MSCHVIELAVVAHKEMSCSASRVNQEKQVEYLEDKLFGHLPSKLWSTEVAISSCLLVDGPLQVQFPRGEYRANAVYIVQVVFFHSAYFCLVSHLQTFLYCASCHCMKQDVYRNF